MDRLALMSLIVGVIATVQRLRAVAVAIFVALGLGSSISAADDSVWGAVGRLKLDDGHCTAFVVRSFAVAVVGKYGESYTIYKNWIVTAGHCTSGPGSVSFVPSVAGRPNLFWGERVIGMSGAGQYDVAILSAWSVRLSPTLELAFGEEPAAGDYLMLVGYGRQALMARVGVVTGRDELGMLIIENYAQPGNSGGPVLVPGTRRVVGIGVESEIQLPPGVTELYPYCSFVGCSRKPPYYAAPVGWLKGLVRWPQP